MIVIPKLKIAYQNVPKNGTSTLFDWLYECVMEQPVRHGNRDGDDAGNRKVRHFFIATSEFATVVDNTAAAVGNLEGYIRFAIVRDPVQRFLSMYSNRVLVRRVLGDDKPMVAQRLAELGLEANPEINRLVDFLEAYCQASPDVGDHARPMVDIMGKDMSLYDRLVDIQSLDPFLDELRAHFAAAGARYASMLPVREKRKKSSVRKIPLEELNPYSFEKLLAFYADDYAHIPGISLEKIKDAYQKARTDIRSRQAPLIARYTQESLAARKARIARIESENQTLIAGKCAAMS